MVTLGRAYRLKQLRGWLGKRLVVPTGYQGVVLFSDGRVRILPPGKHTVLNPWQRLGGKGVGLRVAIVNAGEVSETLDAPHLLSGDGTLIDAAILTTLKISDPALLVQAPVWSEDDSLTLSVNREEIRNALLPLVSEYAAEDLFGTLPTTHVLDGVYAQLTPLLKQKGIMLLQVDLLTFYPSSKRVEIARQVQELESRLDDAKAQEQLAGLETQAQLQGFIQETQPGLRGMGIVTKPAAAGAQTRTLWQRFCQLFRPKTPQPMRLLSALFGGKRDKSGKPLGVSNLPRFWWLGNLLLIAFAVVLAYVLSQIFVKLTDGTNWFDQLEILIPIWGFALAVTLENVRRILQIQEAHMEANWSRPGGGSLNNIARNDRERADALVRQQCAQEIQHINEILEDLQTRIYRGGQGDSDQALRLRNLRRKVDDLKARVLDTQYGRPPYMTDLRVTWRMLQTLLDYDEDLLLHVQALGEKAGKLQQKAGTPQWNANLPDELERELDAFMLRFAGREHVMLISDAQEN